MRKNKTEKKENAKKSIKFLKSHVFVYAAETRKAWVSYRETHFSLSTKKSAWKFRRKLSVLCMCARGRQPTPESNQHEKLKEKEKKRNDKSERKNEIIMMIIIKNVKYTRAHHLTTEFRIQGFHRVATAASAAAVVVTITHLLPSIHTNRVAYQCLYSHSHRVCRLDIYFVV